MRSPSRPQPWAILDTGVYIDHLERGRYGAALDEIAATLIVRHSAVVLSELRRGARTAQALRVVMELRRRATEVWAPAEEDWWEAGALIQKIGDAHGWDRAKRRDFQNDTLIALTARRHGALVVTTNAGDFELLAAAVKVAVRVLA